MTKEKVATSLMSASSKWFLLGLVPLMVGAPWCLMAARQFNLWLYADHYVPAELEVTRFNRNESDGPSQIEGVIHPGGEPVVTNDYQIEMWEFKGQRLAVRYWPQHTDVQRWWHPPTVVMSGAIPGG